MNRLKKVVLLLAMLLVLTLGSNITWVNDGGNGWDAGEDVADTDMDAIKTANDDNYTKIVAIDANVDGIVDEAAAVSANAVTLTTGTAGNYVATIADSGATEVTVTNGTAEGGAVTLALASTITRDTELNVLTVSTTDVVDTTTDCTAGDIYLDTDGPAASGVPRFWICLNSGTNNWAYEDLTD